MTNVIMPQMGESVTEGVITSWYKKVGDWVDKDEPLLSITTDKVDADVPSPGEGYLSKIGFEEGATVVRVGQAIFGARATPDSHYWPDDDQAATSTASEQTA